MMFPRECPNCMDEAEPVERRGAAGEHFRCLQCGEVFILVGSVLVSAEPPEFDLEGARWSRFRMHR